MMSHVSEKAQDPGPQGVESNPHGRSLAEITYCGVCTLPPEYCEFGDTVAECQKWLLDNDKALFDKIYDAEGVENKIKNLSISQAQDQKSADDPAEAAGLNKTNTEAKPKSSKSVGISPQIMIKRSERSKKKYVTVVKGIDGYGIPLKIASKAISSKFACGTSVTKGISNQEEITIQGDISAKVKQFILDSWGEQIKEADIVLK